MSEKGVRRGIINTIFNQEGAQFTASFIASEAGERSAEVYEVFDLMDCVTREGSAQGEKGVVKAYRVTGKPPESCTTCLFNSIRATSCTRAPTHGKFSNSERSNKQLWDLHLQMCDEARTGHLTNVDGDPILSVGHL